MLADIYVELSSAMTRLMMQYLRKTDYAYWLDGVPFDSIHQNGQDAVDYAGLFAVSDDEAKHDWLEAFHASFEFVPTKNSFRSYILCFQSNRAGRQRVPYAGSPARISRKIACPQADEPLRDSEWEYVFRRSVR
jgi:hypothetical protein